MSGHLFHLTSKLLQFPQPRRDLLLKLAPDSPMSYPLGFRRSDRQCRFDPGSSAGTLLGSAQELGGPPQHYLSIGFLSAARAAEKFDTNGLVGQPHRPPPHRSRCHWRNASRVSARHVRTSP